MKLFFLLIVLACPAQAEIFKWVDENGKTHFGDRVPEKYQQKAANVELKIHQPTEADIAEAEKRNSEFISSRKSMESTQKSLRTARSTSRKKSGQSASGQGGKMAEYQQSKACFAACQVRRPKAPVTRRGQGYSYTVPGGSYLDSSACGHCKNVTKPRK
jgi:hypothetical protein